MKRSAIEPVREGAKGGAIMAQGTPEDIAASEASHTGRFKAPNRETAE